MIAADVTADPATAEAAGVAAAAALAATDAAGEAPVTAGVADGGTVTPITARTLTYSVTISVGMYVAITASVLDADDATEAG